MKYFILYCKEKRKAVVLVLVMIAVEIAVSFLYGIRMDAVFYIIQVWVVLMLVAGMVDFYFFCRKYKLLQKNLDNDRLFEIELPDSSSPIEKQYIELVIKQHKEKSGIMEDNYSKMGELKDYYATWAHQIKTPIAALNLITQVISENPEKLDVNQIKSELNKIDFYTEAVMNYLRLEDMSSDYRFDKYKVKSLINKSVMRFSSQFIHKKIAVEIECMDDEYVWTDEKWLSFILEQLISNSLKYTASGGKIRIGMENNSLFVEDNGIGINEEDIPRIMERGYTGYNGRMDKKSSGIGLYLCKKAADKLGISIEVKSQPGKGTRINLYIEQKLAED